MTNRLEMGKNYSVRLLDLYGGVKQNLNVIGETDIDNVSSNSGDYNVYETYFAPIGLGLTSYYTTINKNTRIYICRAIKSLKPYDVDVDNKIFVPESLIDFDKTDEYVKCNEFAFDMRTIIKRYQSDTDTETFEKEIIEKMKNRLDGLIDFSIFEVDINPSKEEVYIEKSIVDLIEADREIKYKEFLSRYSERNHVEQEKERVWNNTVRDMNEKAASYDTMREQLRQEKLRYSALNYALQQKLDELNAAPNVVP